MRKGGKEGIYSILFNDGLNGYHPSSGPLQQRNKQYSHSLSPLFLHICNIILHFGE